MRSVVKEVSDVLYTRHECIGEALASSISVCVLSEWGTRCQSYLNCAGCETCKLLCAEQE